MFMKLFSWVTTNATPRVDSYRYHLNIAWGFEEKFCSCDFWCVDFWVGTATERHDASCVHTRMTEEAASP